MFGYIWKSLMGQTSQNLVCIRICRHFWKEAPPPQMEKLGMMSRMPQESLGLLREVTILHLKLVSWSSLARLCLIHSRYLIGGMGVIRKQ